jgi:OmpA-OmpF porin, OOP family
MKKISVLILVFSVGIGTIYAQSTLERLGKRVVKRAGEQVEQRIERKVEEPTSAQQPQREQIPLQSFSQYDFVPGDKVLLYEDFSQDAVGDFPALWSTNGSGEIKTINISNGNWLHLTTNGNQYQLMKNLNLPDNFIIEFDVILPPTDQNPPAVWITLFKAENEDLGYVENNPLPSGFGVYIEASEYASWLGKAYNNNDWVEGSSLLSPVNINQVEHVIVWIQKRRLRLYHAGQKVLDLPTLIPANFKPNRLAFDNSGCNDSNPYVSNIRITTASPDTRNKLLEEGKLISYGIYFDVNSDRVKPESFGALNDIAKVIKEANVKVQVVGHTDNTGSDATNLDLSKRRATSVKAELVKLGVSIDMLTTDGAGASKPIAPNNTPSNKALNRRVEFVKQ